jgi:ATPase subunit of ABC transporter with duplicated ATPase domains
MEQNSQFAHDDFENEVRRIARYLWPHEGCHGAVIEDGRERDFVIETSSEIVLIEATVSQQKEKARKDIGKLVKLAQQKRRSAPTKAVHCWFVTKNEPTADQREVALRAPYPVSAISFAQFRAKMVDGREYLQLRRNARFGSIEDPRSGHIHDKTKFIPLQMTATSGGQVAFHELVTRTREGNRSVILGDFGAGKSMTMRA